MEKKEIKISLFSFYVLMAGIVLLIGAVLLAWMAVGNNQLVQNNNENIGKTTQLDVNSELVQKLYSYVQTDYEWNNGEGYYKADKTTFSNLDKDIKLLTVLFNMLSEENYNVVKKDKLRVEYDEYEEKYLPVVDLENVNRYSDGGLTHFESFSLAVTDDVYEFDLSSIQETARKIFNNTIDITKNSYSWTGEMFGYDDNMYKYIQHTGAGGVESWNISKIIKAEITGNEIFIYDSFIHCGDGVYATANGELKIADVGFDVMSQLNEENLAKEAQNILGTTIPVYKHTFRKADNGEYYWVSSELINKEELSVIQNNERLEIGRYTVDKVYEDENGITTEGCGIELLNKTDFWVIQGWGSYFYGTYEIVNNQLICKADLHEYDGGSGETESVELKFTFDIIDNKLRLSNVYDPNEYGVDGSVLEIGMTYSIKEEI